jgi:hypothetical protein
MLYDYAKTQNKFAKTQNKFAETERKYQIPK